VVLLLGLVAGTTSPLEHGMNANRHTSAEDILSSIVANTHARHLREWRQIDLSIADAANESEGLYGGKRPHSNGRDHTPISSLAFVILMASALFVSAIVGAFIGLIVLTLIAAFLIVPISALLFILGGCVGAALVYAMLFAERLRRSTRRQLPG
jgi:hypothetical protein